MPNERIYCSEAAADDALAGTAESVDVWFMLEYRPVWPAKAIADNALQPRVRAWIEAQVERGRERRLKVRPQFIRQPGRESAGVALIVADRSGTRRLDVATYEDLLAIDAFAAGARIDAPLYFVCTNGQRDLCCARFGLPAYNALRAAVGDRVWQTTHVGGHRFAPNVLALPQGAVYGRVHERDVDRFLETVAHGLAFDWLRGVSFDAPAVQAARAMSRVPAHVAAQADGDGRDRWRVRFENGVTADVELAPERMAIASCDDAPKATRSWRRVG